MRLLFPVCCGGRGGWEWSCWPEEVQDARDLSRGPGGGQGGPGTRPSRGETPDQPPPPGLPVQAHQSREHRPGRSLSSHHAQTLLRLLHDRPLPVPDQTVPAPESLQSDQPHYQGSEGGVGVRSEVRLLGSVETPVHVPGSELRQVPDDPVPVPPDGQVQ